MLTLFIICRSELVKSINSCAIGGIISSIALKLFIYALLSRNLTFLFHFSLSSLSLSHPALSISIIILLSPFHSYLRRHNKCTFVLHCSFDNLSRHFILYRLHSSFRLLGSAFGWLVESVSDWLTAERRPPFSSVPWWSGILSHSQWTAEWARGSLHVMTLQCLLPLSSRPVPVPSLPPSSPSPFSLPDAKTIEICSGAQAGRHHLITDQKRQASMDGTFG